MSFVRPVLPLVVACGLAGAVCSSAGPVPVAHAGTPPVHAPGAVHPTPQHEVLRGDFVTVTATVTVVTGRAPDPSALRTTEAALRTAGARRIVTVETEPGDRRGRLTVRLGGRAPGLAGLGAEGYVLTLRGGSAHDPGRITLAGVDARGTYYAAQSLRQLLPHSGVPGTRVRGLTVRDQPSTPHRGVIQGFYGTAWSQAAQLDQLDFYGEHKMDTYVYSPKDDPYLRERWRDPYPDEELDQLRQLVDRAKARHVDFTYALSPGLSVCYSSQADVDALTAKFESMWRIGVRSFVIPLDDISYTKWNCAADEKAYGTGAAAAAHAQADLLNRVDRAFIATHRGAAPLQTVPTEYAGTTPKPYKKELAARLDPQVIVQWTGSDVVPATVTAADARSARAVFGHPVLLWDNYPVNDYATDRLLLGPYTGRDRTLPRQVEGIVANPMIQPDASKIALATVADYTWNSTAYDPDASWAASLAELAGGDPKVEGALRAFADVNHASVIDPQQGPDLRGAVRDFWRTGAAAPLDGALRRLAEAPAVLEEGLPDHGFVTDCRPWLDATHDWAQAARTALRMLVAAREGDGTAAWKLRRSLPSRTARAESYRYLDVDGNRIPAVVGEGVLDSFIDDAVAAHDELLGRTPRPKASTDMGTHQYHTPARMTDGDDSTWYWNKQPVPKDSYVRIDLRGLRSPHRVTLAMGAPGAEEHIIDQGVLEYSRDGAHWVRLTAFQHQSEVTADLPSGVQLRYLRARATQDQDALLAVRTFDVTY